MGHAFDAFRAIFPGSLASGSVSQVETASDGLSTGALSLTFCLSAPDDFAIADLVRRRGCRVLSALMDRRWSKRLDRSAGNLLCRSGGRAAWLSRATRWNFVVALSVVPCVGDRSDRATASLFRRATLVGHCAWGVVRRVAHGVSHQCNRIRIRLGIVWLLSEFRLSMRIVH